MEPTQGFVEVIEFKELEFYEVVGKGAFGVVSRAKWKSKDVAVKLIETESERKAFMTELKQLSRVNHPNIVKLYGACTKPPTVCLVMEYAEGGSLYNVLHGAGPQPIYNTAHAMSWLLQCAKGVEYLHDMKPKALIHRDLKPPNLLLIMGGTVLKICDFGTACDIQTHMTNNKGSAAWMAPEVFEGNMYSEKCDVFSFGIILWEVITRRKPFDEIGGPAFRIMWAVHNGTRPPLISNLPKPLELLMTRCWSGNPAERPSMVEVHRIMAHLFQFFRGAEEPLVYPINQQSCDSPDFTFSTVPVTSYSNTPPSSNTSTTSIQTGESRSGTLISSDTIRQRSDGFQSPPPPLPPRANPPVNPPVLFEDEQARGQQSAPASLAASRESLHDPRSTSRSGTPVDHLKRYSADSRIMECDIREITNSSGSSGNSYKGTGLSNAEAFAMNLVYHSLDQQLQPITPYPPSQESMEIYQQHCELGQEYLKVQTELALLIQRKNDLLKECEIDEQNQQSSTRMAEEYSQIREENESLTLLRQNLSKQVDSIRRIQQRR